MKPLFSGRPLAGEVLEESSVLAIAVPVQAFGPTCTQRVIDGAMGSANGHPTSLRTWKAEVPTTATRNAISIEGS